MKTNAWLDGCSCAQLLTNEIIELYSIGTLSVAVRMIRHFRKFHNLTIESMQNKCPHTTEGSLDRLGLVAFVYITFSQFSII